MEYAVLSESGDTVLGYCDTLSDAIGFARKKADELDDENLANVALVKIETLAVFNNDGTIESDAFVSMMEVLQD